MHLCILHLADKPGHTLACPPDNPPYRPDQASPRLVAVALTAAAAVTGAVTVPFPRAGVGDAAGHLDNDVRIVVERPVARPVGGLPMAGCSAVAGGACDAAVVIAVLAGHIGENGPVRPAGVSAAAVAGIAAGRRVAFRCGLGVASLAVGRSTGSRRIGVAGRFVVGVAAARHTA